MKEVSDSTYKYNYGKTLATVNDEEGEFYVAKAILSKLNDKGKEVKKAVKFLVKCASIKDAETIINENMPAYMDSIDDAWEGWTVESISMAKVEMIFD